MAGIERLAKQVAAHGRHGDTRLVHMNPEEIAVLQSMLGEMTVNPETGQLEAFSWKKLLAGIGVAAGAAMMAIPGLQPFGMPLLAKTAPLLTAALLPMAATGAAGLITSSLKPGESKKSTPNASEAGAYEDARNAAQMKNMFRFPQRQEILPDAVADTTGAQRNYFGYRQPVNDVQPMQSGIGSLDYPTPDPLDYQTPARGYAEGGALEPEEMEAHRVMAEAMAAIEGKSPNPEKAINDFIAMFGKEALAELMGQVEQSDSAVRGPGGGMDDMVSADLQGQKVLLSPNEHIIPADAVSNLGDGSSDAGHRELDAMIERIRVNKTGNPAQPAKIDRKVMAS